MTNLTIEIEITNMAVPTCLRVVAFVTVLGNTNMKDVKSHGMI